MAVENAPLLAFNRGVVSPLALSRVDLKRIALSAEIQENWMPRVMGSMSLRQGLQYITNTNGNNSARYIPFLFSISDTALIELTDNTMRVLVGEVPITRAVVGTAVLNGTFPTALTSWTNGSDVGGTVTWVSSGNVSFQGDGVNAALLYQSVPVALADVGQRHALRVQIAQGDELFIRVGNALNGTDYVTETLLLPGTHSLSFVPTSRNFVITLYSRASYVSILNSCVVEGPGVVTLPTVWGVSDLNSIRFDQSADVIFVACNGRPPQRIERHGTYSWSVVEYISDDGPFGLINTSPTTFTPSALSGSVTITASKPIFDNSFIDQLVSITSVGQNVAASFSAANVFSNPIQVTGLTARRGFGIVITGTFSGTVTLQQSIGAIGSWTDVTNWTGPISTSYNDSLDNQIIFYRLGIKAGNYTSGTAVCSLTYAGGSITGLARFTGSNMGILAALTPATATTDTAPYDITVSPEGTHAYATNTVGADISQFSRAAGTGLLTALAPATISTGAASVPVGIVVSPDGKNVYTAHGKVAGEVGQFSRNTSTGLLTALTPAIVSAGTSPRGIAISPDGLNVYLTNNGSNSVSQYVRDPVTGLLSALTPATIATPAGNAERIVISPDGLNAYVTVFATGLVAQFSRNPTTGLLAALTPASIAAGTGSRGLVISPNGSFVYAVNYTAGTLSGYRRNPATGLLTALSPAATTLGATPYFVAMSPDGTSIYAVVQGGNTIAQFGCSTVTGALTPLVPATIATGAAPLGIALAPDGTSVYATNNGAGAGTTLSQYSRQALGTVMFASVTQAFGATTPSSAWYLGEWSTRRGFPSAVAFHQGRLAWAGKGKFWATVSGSYISFDRTQIGDAGPLNEDFGAGMVDKIEWLLSSALFIAGGQSTEHVIRSDALDAPITPVSVNIKPATSHGAASVTPVKVDQSAIFVSKSGSRVFEVASDAYATAYNLYTATDMTVLAPEICRPSVVRMAAQRDVDTRLHFVLSDGTVAVLVYDKAEDVKGWVKVTTAGLVEDVVVIPAGSGQAEDNVYYVVARTVGGATVRFLEKFSLESETTGRPVARLADAHVNYAGAAVATISGLGHLEGQIVVCWGWNTITPFLDPDTGTAVGRDFGSFTVTGGAITIPTAVTNACVGLGYSAHFESTKLAYAAQMGTALNQRKRIPHLGLLLRDTHAQGLQYGSDLTHLDNLPQMEAGATVDANKVWTSYDFDATEFNDSYTTDSRLHLVANAPRPCTVSAAIITVETHEKT